MGHYTASVPRDKAWLFRHRQEEWWDLCCGQDEEDGTSRHALGTGALTL